MCERCEYERLKRQVGGLGATGSVLRNLDAMVPRDGLPLVRKMIEGGKPLVQQINKSAAS